MLDTDGTLIAATIKETPGVLNRVQRSILRQYQACIASDGGNFNHLI